MDIDFIVEFAVVFDLEKQCLRFERVKNYLLIVYAWLTLLNKQHGSLSLPGNDPWRIYRLQILLVQKQSQLSKGKKYFHILSLSLHISSVLAGRRIWHENTNIKFGLHLSGKSTKSPEK